jgi:hypothetical protein
VPPSLKYTEGICFKNIMKGASTVWELVQFEILMSAVAPDCIMTSDLTELSTKNILGGKGRLVYKAHNLITIR